MVIYVLREAHRTSSKARGAKANAEVSELADEQVSGPCGSNTMRVQVPFSARFVRCT